MLTVRAAAKINLSLEILGKRPDGYHELVSVMREVTLVDELRVSHSDDIALRTNTTDIPDGVNLVLRAARAMQERFKPDQGAHLSLEKRIPLAAGLGGGSSDAAATLVALRQLWGVDATCHDYLDLASSLGSDVSFFLYGGTSLVEGRGERVVPLPDGPEAWYVLVNPGVRVSTAHVFNSLASEDRWEGSATCEVAARSARNEDPGIGTNSLQTTLFSLYPDAERCFETTAELAPRRTIVSGSGPTVVAQFDGANQAGAAAAELARYGYWTATVRNRPRKGDRPCASS